MIRQRCQRLRRYPLRTAIDALAFAVACFATFLVALDTGGLVRKAVVVAFVLTVPGWTIVSRLHLDDASFEVVLTVALSIAIGTILSLSCLAIGWFEPRWFVSGLGLLCALLTGSAVTPPAATSPSPASSELRRS